MSVSVTVSTNHELHRHASVVVTVNTLAVVYTFVCSAESAKSPSLDSVATIRDGDIAAGV